MSVHLYIVLLLWTLVAGGVGIHASNRGRSGFLWGFVTFFTGLLGLVIYLVVLANAADSPSDDDSGAETLRVCPACSSSHPGTPAYCSDCGEPLGPDDETGVATVLRSGSRGYCSNCKARVGLDADRCSDCGCVF